MGMNFQYVVRPATISVVSTPPLAIGAPAPRFTLDALGSGRTFKLAALRGRNVLLLFVDRHTARAARDLVEIVRRRYPDHEWLTIAMVIDLNHVPKMLRGAAQHFIESSYTEAAALIPAPYDPADHLIMLPDWTGQLFQGYHIANASQSIAAVLVDTDGHVAEIYQGPDLTEHLMAALAVLDGAGNAET